MSLFDFNLFKKIRYFRVVLIKIAISFIILFLPISTKIISKNGLIFIIYLLISILYACYSLSRNYLFTFITLILFVGGLIYFDSLVSTGVISEKTYTYTCVIGILFPFIYDLYIMFSIIVNKAKKQI